MVTDHQVRRLRMLIKKEKTKAIAASKAGMNEKTAREYLKHGKLPSQCKVEHNWRTREDPFEDIREEIKSELVKNPFVSAKPLFEKIVNKGYISAAKDNPAIRKGINVINGKLTNRAVAKALSLAYHKV